MSRPRITLASALLVVVAALDQITKRWAVGALTDGARHAARTVSVSSGWFDLHYSENTGMAFGGLQGYGGALTIIGIVALVVVVRLLIKHPQARYRSVAALGLIAGGAIGNLADRLRVGYVVDFIVWHVGDKHVRIGTSDIPLIWPAFNIADAALVVGVAMILIWPEKDPVEATADARKS